MLKFIGQHIVDLIARFRSDVFLEDVSSGTIASGGNLGLDSNNKIVKANVPTSHDAVTLTGTPDYITISGQEITRNEIDLANDVTGTLPVANGGTGLTSISTLLNSNVTDISGNAGTATALTSGDKTIEGNLRIGGSGDTSNNWISIDAQNGSDTTGGGITFYETGTYSVSAPQYGAKIVYNEDDDELAIGTMHNNTFMRQIHMDRSGSQVLMQNIKLQHDSTNGPYVFFLKTDTSVADGDSLARIIVRNSDRGTSTNNSQIQWFATEDHDSNSCGTKINFTVTPNGNSQSETTAMTIDQDSSVTVNGDLTVTSGTSGDATLIISADTDNNDENDNARLWFKQDGDLTEGAIQMSSNVLNIINNVSSSGGISFQTGTTDNTGTTDPSTGATERMSIASGGTVTVAGALQPNTIELGHASDTTIARSAAGKVTIEGANVQTTQICCTHHNMSLDGSSSTVDYYFPINSLADGSSSGLYYTRVVAAYDGKIVKILFRGNSLSGNSFGSSSIIYMSRRAHDGTTYYHQTSGFQASETFNGSSQSTIIVPCGVGGANAADWVFEEGDVLGFSLVKNTTATDIDLATTIVWEYTV